MLVKLFQYRLTLIVLAQIALQEVRQSSQAIVEWAGRRQDLQITEPPWHGIRKLLP